MGTSRSVKESLELKTALLDALQRVDHCRGIHAAEVVDRGVEHSLGEQFELVVVESLDS